MDHLTFAQMLGSYGEFVGAIGVIATLIYLSRQIRINTRQLKAQSIVTMNSDHNESLKYLDSNLELLGLFLRSAGDWNAISAKEQARVHLLHTRYTNTVETAFLLMSQGCLDEAMYRKREDDLIAGLNGPGHLEWWSTFKALFTQEFQARIDQRLTDPDNAPHYFRQVSFYDPDVWS